MLESCLRLTPITAKVISSGAWNSTFRKARSSVCSGAMASVAPPRLNQLSGKSARSARSNSRVRKLQAGPASRLPTGIGICAGEQEVFPRSLSDKI